MSAGRWRGWFRAEPPAPVLPAPATHCGSKLSMSSTRRPSTRMSGSRTSTTFGSGSWNTMPPSTVLSTVTVLPLNALRRFCAHARVAFGGVVGAHEARTYGKGSTHMSTSAPCVEHTREAPPHARLQRFRLPHGAEHASATHLHLCSLCFLSLLPRPPHLRLSSQLPQVSLELLAPLTLVVSTGGPGQRIQAPAGVEQALVLPVPAHDGRDARVGADSRCR